MPEAPRTEFSTPRERRRAETRREILDAALEVMTEEGVAALKLTQVAARVGLRQPSLYQYFPSREAVYDALFERGMTDHLRAVTAAVAAAAPGWAAARSAAHATLRFGADQPVLAQLLFHAAVPGFHPSERAYAPSLEVQRLVTEAITAAVERGELHAAAASERGVRMFVSVVAGVSNERSANRPDLRGERQLQELLDPSLDMYAGYFTPTRPRTWSPWTASPEPRRTRASRATHRR